LGLAKATELHLQGNKLTVQSLPKLGDVIASSAGDLRELDISRNDIRIVTEEEKAIWKSFLSSFKNCYMLKKLDLAGNPIGTLGLEILARSYIKSDLDFLEADAEAIVRQNHTFSTDVSDGEGAALAEEAAVLKINVKATSDCKGARVKKSPSKVGRAARQNGMDFPLIQLVIVVL
jgi:Leucine-rich repeat (LRR) protein